MRREWRLALTAMCFAAACTARLGVDESDASTVLGDSATRDDSARLDARATDSSTSDTSTVPSDATSPMDAMNDASTSDTRGDTAAFALAIRSPVSMSDVYESVVVIADAPVGTTSVEFFVDGETTPRCTDAAAPFRCLVHLAPAGPEGDVTLRARMTSPMMAESSVVVRRRLIALAACDTNVRACVNAWVTEGTAAGYTGFTYENRDGEHASLDRSNLTGLNYVTHNEGVQLWGSTGVSMDANAVVIGNASQAYTTIGYSLVRYQILMAGAATRFERTYTTNKIFFFPEHRDVGIEDYYSFLSPAAFMSQGSSGSELDEVEKWVVSLGAMPPAVFATLRTAGAIMPALHALHRRTRAPSDADYLTGRWHPTAVGDAPSTSAMVRHTHALEPTWIPPQARFTVTSETFPAGQTLLSSTGTNAHHFASTGPAERSVVVDANTSRDFGGRPLTYHWRVLRGDAAYVTITPMNEDESVATILFRANPAASYMGDGGGGPGTVARQSHLLVVGLFVHNGRYFSMPAFITSYGTDPRRSAPDPNNLD